MNLEVIELNVKKKHLKFSLLKIIEHITREWEDSRKIDFIRILEIFGLNINCFRIVIM